MAMRFIIRRQNAEELSDIRQKIEALDTLLGNAGDNFRRTVPIVISPLRSLHYLFLARKTATGWSWVCPSIELVAENETGLLTLAQGLGIQSLPHLFGNATTSSSP